MKKYFKIAIVSLMVTGILGLSGKFIYDVGEVAGTITGITLTAEIICKMDRAFHGDDAPCVEISFDDTTPVREVLYAYKDVIKGIFE